MITKKATLDHTPPSVHICLADPHSGFILWKEPLDTTCEYKATQKNFHTFKIVSSEEKDGGEGEEEGEGGGEKEEEGNRKMAGIRFPIPELADIFLKNVVENIERVNGEGSVRESLSHMVQEGEIVRLRSHSAGSSTSSSRRKILKTQISRPCMFTHVTSAVEIRKDSTTSKKGLKLAKVKLK